MCEKILENVQKMTGNYPEDSVKWSRRFRGMLIKIIGNTIKDSRSFISADNATSIVRMRISE